jgi:phosphatidate cytidylyltransferase
MTTILGLPANVVYFTAGIYALLALATAVVLFMRWRNPGERYAELMARTDSWWWMIGAFTLAILLNQTVAVVFLALIAYLALKEYLSLVPTRRIDREVLLFAYLAIPIQFYWAAIDWYNMFIVFVPVWMYLFFPALMALRGQTQGFLRAVGTLSWGLMMTVYTLSHMAWLLVSGDRVSPVAGGVGLLFFLVVLTQFNDVAQYCWGKPLGRHKVTPNVSPEKDLGGPNRRHCHHHAGRGARGPVSHADGLALVGAGGCDPRGVGLSRRHHHVGDEARSWREGHRRADPRPWRHSRSRR